jgi:mono/diheme cytochrome c family protein
MKNPVPANADSLSLGKDLYDEHCLMCHGEKGMGDGAMADTLSRPPGNLADPQVMEELTDGELFWRISKGDDLMPSFETEKPLPEEDRWHIINYVRTLANSAQ